MKNHYFYIELDITVNVSSCMMRYTRAVLHKRSELVIGFEKACGRENGIEWEVLTCKNRYNRVMTRWCL